MNESDDVSHRSNDLESSSISIITESSRVITKSPRVITEPPRNTTAESFKRDRERSRKHFVQINYNYINAKVSQYTDFRQKEIAELLKTEVFRTIKTEDISIEERVFNSRFVDEIKHLETERAFEKSRLVIQTYNDLNKNLILIQTSSIQRVSQRLIVCLTIMLEKRDINIYLRDITQAYIQSKSDLNRNFYIRSSSKLIKLLDASLDCILKVIKPLYEVLESSNH
jgi:hypothetical protein